MHEKELIKTLSFSPKDKTANIYHKAYTSGYVIEVDFENALINYGKEIKSDSKTTQNFSQTENFVVLECVDRLLTKGYKPKDISLEKVFPSGHGHSGRLDIFVKNGKKPFLMIECKTFGKEFEKEFANIQKNGGQLFTYFQNDTNTDYLMLYSSSLLNGKIEYRSEIIKIEDSYRTAGNVEDVYNRWNKITYNNGIFDKENEPYQFQNKQLVLTDLKTLAENDSGFIFNSFASILRKHSVSDKPNAFNKIFNLFLAKLFDEGNCDTDKKRDTKALDFQWKEGVDDDVEFQVRLINLHKQGISRFLEKEIEGLTDEELQAQQNPAKFKKKWLKFNKIFDIKDVNDDMSFDDNARVLKEVVQLLEKYRIRYPNRQQHLSDFFERLLTTGLKQEAGQYFTPVPITRFIVRSLPLKEMIIKTVNQPNPDPKLPVAIDYAAGSGHFLTEILEIYQDIINTLDTADFFNDAQKGVNAWKANPYGWASKYIYGIEKDYRLVKVAKVGCYFYGDGLAQVIHGDGLDSFENSKVYKGLLKQNAKHPQFDIVVSNPPYSVDAFRGDLRNKDAKEDFTLYQYLTDKSSEIECLFVERTAQLLKEGGVAGVILPGSLLSNAGIYTKTREIILKKFEIIAVAALGSNTFMATGTNTVILFLRRRKDSAVRNVEEGVAAFLDSLKDMTICGVENAASEYARAVWNVSVADYGTLLKKEPNDAVKKTALYKEYYKTYPREDNYFNDDTPLAVLEKMKEKYQDAVKKYWESITALEAEKMLYFILTYPQKTVLIKTGEKNAEKRFLGYEFSNRRGFEGIHPVERRKTISECTKLFDDDRVDNPEKASAYIYKAFSGDYEYSVHESLKENVFRVRLVDMLTFDRKSFDKTISIAIKQNVEFRNKWKSIILEKAAKIVRGVTYSKDDQTSNKTDKIILTADNITLNGNLEIKKQVYLRSDFEISEEKKLKANDIFICFSSGSKKHLGKVAFIQNDTDYYAGGFMAIIRVFDDNNPKFVYLLLNSLLRQTVRDIGSGSNINNLSLVIDEIKIPLPPKPVQEKIVAEIEALEKQEHNMADRIASLKKEIYSLFLFDVDMNTEKLGNMAVLLKRGKSAKYGKSNIQIIKSGQARGYRKFDFSERYFVDENFVLDERRLEKGDILINSTGVGTAGRVTLFNFDGDFVADSHITILRVDKSVVDPLFVLYALAENIGFKNIESMAQGQSGQIELSLSIIKNIRIPLPPLAEQQKITAEIEKLEDEIQALQKRLEETAGQKELRLKKHLQ
jgi:type I restriction enzyme M protein